MFLELVVSALVIFAICFLFGYNKARKQKTLEELVEKETKPVKKTAKKTSEKKKTAKKKTAKKK